MKAKVAKVPKWRGSLATGHEGLDEKRKKILDVLSRCLEVWAKGLKGEQLVKLLSDGLDLIAACLKYEEILLKNSGWEGFDLHLALHDRWRDEARRLLASEGMTEPEVLLDFAARWWESHLAEDVKYGKRLERAGL